MTIAMQLKEEGNKMFKAKKFEEAKQFYSQAIEKCPVTEEKNMAIFYQNRAAANDAMVSRPRFHVVGQGCFFWSSPGTFFRRPYIATTQNIITQLTPFFYFYPRHQRTIALYENAMSDFYFATVLVLVSDKLLSKYVTIWSFLVHFKP